MAGSVPPPTGRFDYQATRDGEYWFAVRTLDGNNQLFPAGEIDAAGLKVIVDTTPPRFDLQVRPVAGDRVQLSWNAADANLDVRTLKLEFMQSGGIHWEPVSIQPQAVGQTSWSVPKGGWVAVRGSIADRAGNVKSAENESRLQQPSQPARPARRQLDGPVAIAPGTPMITPGTTRPTISPGNPASSGNPAENSFAAQPTAPAVLPERYAGRTAGIGQPAVPQPTIEPGAPKFGGLVSGSVETRPDILRRPLPANSGAPTITKRTRVVNTRQFHIDYEVEDVGSSGVGSVELYITEDDGNTWYRYGDDPDLTSPFVVEAPQDGIYGFSLRVRSGAGLAADPPQPREKPSIVVVVDQTPPQIRFDGATQGRGADLAKIAIRWNLREEHPSDAPVALSYTTEEGGLWEPITGWIADTGEYVWSVGPNMPPRIYIRVTARDAAGNLSRVESQEPLLVDLSRPSARIVDVEAANNRPIRP